MWNQWSAGPPPMPPPSVANPHPPLIGPVQPSPGAPPSSDPPPPSVSAAQAQPAPVSAPSGAPSYTPAQYAAMTPEQQYAVQQHWQQWQAYEQQYAQWHAQYGEQYKREMAAIHGAPPPAIPQYSSASTQPPILNSFAYPPPAVNNPYQAPPVPVHAPPPPPPDDNTNSMNIKAAPQIYDQPPPPPPPPQSDEKQGIPLSQGGCASNSDISQGHGSRWSQPPPQIQIQASSWNETGAKRGQQDKQQQNQQFNNNNTNQRGRQNQREQYRDEQDRDNRQGNKQNNDFRGRGRSRGGNNYENKQFDESEGRNNRQQQQWQQFGSPGKRNNRGNYSNRFENDNNPGQNITQQHGWNKNNEANNSQSPDNQRQQQNIQNQGTLQNSIKGGVVDEKAFDEQFRLWEEQFENWKKENANHPDRTMYMQYERNFEKTRIRLLERREQMRRRKMLEQQQSMPQTSQETTQQPNLQPPQELPQQHCVIEKGNISETKPGETSDMEQSENEDADQITSKKEIDEKSQKLESSELTMFQNNEITDLFKAAGGGIPGLDLVGSKDDTFKSVDPPEGENISDVIDLDMDGPSRPAKVAATSSSIAALLPSTMQNIPIKPSLPDVCSRQLTPFINSHQPIQKKIPSLFDIVIEKPILSPDLEHRNTPPVRDVSPTASKSSNADVDPGLVASRSDSIPKEQESPSQRPSSVLSLSSLNPRQHSLPNNLEGSNNPFSNDEPQQFSNLPSQAADIAKALQDPNVMQLLNVALAQAQSGGLSQCNPQQAQLLQQLKQIQPLLQMQQERINNNQSWNHMQQDRNTNNQRWNNSQDPNTNNLEWQNSHQDRNFNNQGWNSSQQDRNSNIQSRNNSQRSQTWQNQNSNNQSIQNRNSWGGNPFNRNNDQFSSRGSLSGNESDGKNDLLQKNPHNPFRRSGNGQASDDNSGIPQNNSGDFQGGQRPFNNNNPQGGTGQNPFNNKRGVTRVFDGPDGQDRGGNFGVVGSSNNTNNQGASGQNPFNSTQGVTGLFGGPDGQDRGGNFGGGGRLDKNRPQSNFGNSLGFRNNSNNFGDRCGNDNDYYRPAQVFDYQNRSFADSIVPTANVVDYGHKPSAVMQTNSFNREKSEFVPVKTIDYGHASNSVQSDNLLQQKNVNFMNKISRWGHHNKERQVESKLDTQSYENLQTQGQTQFREQHFNKDSPKQTLQSKSRFHQQQNKLEEEQNPDEITNQINTTSDDICNPTKSEINEDFTELDGEIDYPKNKWMLQNAESRQRPGPPTKRGLRNSSVCETRQKADIPFSQYSNPECDEIEENFEEISDNEVLSETEENPLSNSPIKGKSLPLFPSVSNAISNKGMVFPSMENNNTIPIDEILFKPGRLTRPKKIVIIIRGPPGSGKSYVAKLIKDKEIEMGGPTPRLLSIDDYFMIENDYEEKCPKTGRKIPKKEILYEYEKDMENTYMQYLIKSFKKTIADHLFDLIIVDCCNQSLRTFNEFYNAARDGNFSPFIVDMICDIDICLEQNVHNRNVEEIKDIIKNYQECPGHYIKLDVSNLLENVVEMEDVSDLEDNFAADSEVVDLVQEEEEEANDSNDGELNKSKWDTDPTTENLARLDGTSKPISKRGTATLEEYLQIDGWVPPPSDGKKRVRWADIEEKRAQDKMRAIGFVVGQTDWNRMMDPTSGSGALTKTKYIERLNKRR